MADPPNEFDIPVPIRGGSPRQANEPQILAHLDLQDEVPMIPEIPNINNQGHRMVVNALSLVQPEIPINDGLITCEHYIPIVKKMGCENLHEVRNRQEHALILLRLANDLEVRYSENATYNNHFIHHLDYYECLHTLERDMIRADQTIGVHQDSKVYVMKDQGPYVQCLQWVAAQLQEE